MRNIWIVALAAGLNLAGFATPAAAEDRELVTIEVVVVNHSRVLPGVLATAQQLAARIYARMNIHIVWLDSTPRANAAVTSASRRLAVIIVPESSFGHRMHTMGFAVNGGTLAYTFYRRVEDFSRLRGISPANILGHALAHELGHLLLPNRPHAASGIMRSSWDRGHELMILKNSDTGLAFTLEEAQLVRSDAVRKRE
jgi:hypothetical protein